MTIRCTFAARLMNTKACAFDVQVCTRRSEDNTSSYLMQPTTCQPVFKPVT